MHSTILTISEKNASLAPSRHFLSTGRNSLFLLIKLAEIALAPSRNCPCANLPLLYTIDSLSLFARLTPPLPYVVDMDAQSRLPLGVDNEHSLPTVHGILRLALLAQDYSPEQRRGMIWRWAAKALNHS